VGALLVTGAPGRFADRLLESFAASPPPGLRHLRCLVHPSVPHFDAGAWSRALGLEVEVLRGDLTDLSSLERAVRGVDSIIHGAGIIHVEHIREYYDVNTEGTRLLTEAAARAGTERMVFISTNAAGGRSDSADHLLREDEPAKPLSHYGRSKLLGERAMFAVATPMRRVALRPCMFYGPPVPERHVDVFRRILHGRMPLVGGGDYSRSLTHLDHLVEATRLALVGAAAKDTYYVADARVYTTRGVVEAMARALGVTPRWIPLPGFAASLAYELDTQLSRAGVYWQNLHLVGEGNWHVGVSIDRARRDLGYHPTHDIDDGMRASVEWCRARNLI
jgi:UDP-glucose 4-epimerase